MSIELYLGDCLVENKKIADESVDLILMDPPYGTMDTDGGRKLGVDGWDLAISPADIFKVMDRILRGQGRAVIFSQEPYTSSLITQAPPNLNFSYRAVWKKDNFANALGSKKAMVNYYEDILIFSKREGVQRNPAKDYTDKVRGYIDKGNPAIYSDFEAAGFKKYAVLDTFNSDTARRYNCPSAETYSNLDALYSIRQMEGYMSYEDLRGIFEAFQSPSTFNLWEGKKYKSNVLEYKKDYDGHHPTQKPVALLEDLIKTFSNEGDVVADLTMGSGSTGVACVNTGRGFRGIELGTNFFKIAEDRIYGAETDKLLEI